MGLPKSPPPPSTLSINVLVVEHDEDRYCMSNCVCVVAHLLATYTNVILYLVTYIHAESMNGLLSISYIYK